MINWKPKCYVQALRELYGFKNLQIGRIGNGISSLRQFGNGRLARLDAYDGGPPLIYEGIREPVYVRLPLIFYQPTPGIWKIIR